MIFVLHMLTHYANHDLLFTQHGDEFAIKVLQIDKLQCDDKLVIENERKILRSLDHPNILQ